MDSGSLFMIYILCQYHPLMEEFIYALCINILNKKKIK